MTELSRSMVLGTVAGMAGIVTLDIATYADMVVRGRPASSIPSEFVKRVAAQFGLTALSADDGAASNRRSGIAALLGYADGLTVGILYGMLRPYVRRLPVPIAGLLAGAAAMALADVPYTKAGLTDPSKWSAGDWLSDAVPHAMYGLVVASTYDVLAEK